MTRLDHKSWGESQSVCQSCVGGWAVKLISGRLSGEIWSPSMEPYLRFVVYTELSPLPFNHPCFNSFLLCAKRTPERKRGEERKRVNEEKPVRTTTNKKSVSRVKIFSSGSRLLPLAGGQTDIARCIFITHSYSPPLFCRAGSFHYLDVCLPLPSSSLPLTSSAELKIVSLLGGARGSFSRWYQS